MRGAQSLSGKAAGDRSNRTGWATANIWLPRGMETVTLLLVCLSPWAFASIHPIFESLLLSGVALLMLLWAARLLIERTFSFRLCPVTLCLGGIVLLGLWQSTPLAPSVLGGLSPATADLHQRLLPAHEELLANGQPYETAGRPARATISLYPGATRREVVRLLAVFLLLLVVRYNVASRDSLRRLSITMLVNGSLLSYFGLVQYFSSPQNVLYWTYDTLGTAFGPFINRNHFAFYVNICLGLGIGLLLSARSESTQPGGAHRRRRQRSGRRTENSGSAPREVTNGSSASVDAAHQTKSGPVVNLVDSLLEMLREPRTLWIVVSLTLMLSGVVMCLSRGGVLALIAGSTVCLLVKLTRSSRFGRGHAILLTVALMLAMLTWFGFDLLESRYATLWDGQALNDGRFKLWQYALMAVRDFPLWGTGYGTFAYVEPWYRPRAVGLDTFWDYAHNDYLQAAVEGGLLRLLLTLLAIGWLYRLALRAFARYHGHRTGGLVLGAVFALTTVVVHGLVEFGLQMPAIACLVTVLCAHLCALGDRSGDAKPNTSSPRHGSPANRDDAGLRLGAAGSIVAAVTAVLLALVLHAEGRRADLAQRFRLSAYRAQRESDMPQAISAWESAVRITPEDTILQEELASAHFRISRGSDPDGLDSASLTTSPHRIEAQRHFLNARDLCPLSPVPQGWLAAHATELAQADPPEAYLRRALLLRPFDPQLWYIHGLQAFGRGDQDQALASWKKSLQLAPTYLRSILAESVSRVPAETMRQQLLPPDPQLVYQAVQQLYPEPSLDPAGQLLAQRGAARSATDYQLQAVVCRALNRPDQALQAYTQALQRDVGNVAWRLQYAQLLIESGQLEKARRQLRLIVRQQPQHAQAGRLLKQVISQQLRSPVHELP